MGKKSVGKKIILYFFYLEKVEKPAETANPPFIRNANRCKRVDGIKSDGRSGHRNKPENKEMSYEEEAREYEKGMNIHKFMMDFELMVGQGWREADQNHRQSKRNHNNSGAYHWPANMTTVRLLTDWYTQEYTEVDFTGDTYEMAMRRICRFYKKSKNRKNLGDHQFIEGMCEKDGVHTICIGS